MFRFWQTWVPLLILALTSFAPSTVWCAPILSKAGVFRYNLRPHPRGFPTDIVVRFDKENSPVLLDFHMTVGGQILTMNEVRGVFWMIDTYEDGHHLVIVTESDFFGRTIMLKYNYAGGGLSMIPQFGERLALDFSAKSEDSYVGGERSMAASRLPDDSARDFHRLVPVHYASPNCQTLIMENLTRLGRTQPQN